MSGDIPNSHMYALKVWGLDTECAPLKCVLQPIPVAMQFKA